MGVTAPPFYVWSRSTTVPAFGDEDKSDLQEVGLNDKINFMDITNEWTKSVGTKGIQTPDYLIDGNRFDLKSPTGKGRNLIYGLISKKRKQSDNFVIDISNCPLSDEEVEMQIERLYTSPRTGFLEKIVLIKGKEVIKVYGKK